MRVFFGVFFAAMTAVEFYLSAGMKYEVPVDRQEFMPLPVFLLLSNLWVLPAISALLSADVIRRSPFPALYGTAVTLLHAAVLVYLKVVLMKGPLSEVGRQFLR